MNMKWEVNSYGSGTINIKHQSFPVYINTQAIMDGNQEIRHNVASELVDYLNGEINLTDNLNNRSYDDYSIVFSCGVKLKPCGPIFSEEPGMFKTDQSEFSILQRQFIIRFIIDKLLENNKNIK